MAKESFVLFTKQMVALARVMDDRQLGGMFRLILSHESGEEAAPSDDLALAWAMVKQQLEANDAKYKAISEMRRENGRKGGLAKSLANAKQDVANASKPTYNDNVNDIKENISKDISKKREVFQKPTTEEVADYCRERNNGIVAQEFIDYYDARGWKMNGGVAVKDWRACVRTWEKRRKPSANNVNDLRNEY